MSNPERKKRRAGRIILTVFVAMTVVAASLYFLRRATAEEYRTFQSPDARYKVVVYRYPTPYAMMPGQSGDAPGFVQLHDSRGRTLGEAPVELVSAVERVDWEESRVSVKLVAEWQLPR